MLGHLRLLLNNVVKILYCKCATLNAKMTFDPKMPTTGFYSKSLMRKVLSMWTETHKRVKASKHFKNMVFFNQKCNLHPNIRTLKRSLKPCVWGILLDYLHFFSFYQFIYSTACCFKLCVMYRYIRNQNYF